MDEDVETKPEKEILEEELRDLVTKEFNLTLFHLFFRYDSVKKKIVANNAPFRDTRRSMPILFYNVISERARRVLLEKYNIDLDEEYWREKREKIEERRKKIKESGKKQIPPKLDSTYQILDAERLKGLFCPLTFSQDKLTQGNTRILLAQSPEELEKNRKKKKYFNPILYNYKLPDVTKPYLYNPPKRLSVSLWGFLTAAPFIYIDNDGNKKTVYEIPVKARLPKNREEMELTADGSCIVSRRFIDRIRLIPARSKTLMKYYDFEITPTLEKDFDIKPSHPYVENGQLVVKGDWLGEFQQATICGTVTKQLAYSESAKKRIKKRLRILSQMVLIREEINKLEKSKPKTEAIRKKIKRLKEKYKKLDSQRTKILIPRPLTITLNFEKNARIYVEYDKNARKTTFEIEKKKTQFNIYIKTSAKKWTAAWLRVVRVLAPHLRIISLGEVKPHKDKALAEKWKTDGKLFVDVKIAPKAPLYEYTVVRDRLFVGDKLQSLSGLKVTIAKIDPEIDNEEYDIVINSNQLREKTKPETGKRGWLELELLKTGYITIYIRPITMLEYGTSPHGVRLSNTTIQTLLSIRQYDKKAFEIIHKSLRLEPKQDVRDFMLAKRFTWKAGFVTKTKNGYIWTVPPWIGADTPTNKVVRITDIICDTRIPSRPLDFLKFFRTQYRNCISHPKCIGIYRRVEPHDWKRNLQPRTVFKKVYPNSQEKYSMYEIGLHRMDWEKLGRPKYVYVVREPTAEPTNIKLMKVYLLPENEPFIVRVDIRAMEDMNGDSVTKDTPIYVKDKETGLIDIVPIEKLAKKWYKRKDGKEIAPLDILVWNGNNWEQTVQIIRHKTNKKIYRIYTRHGIIDVTEDHSLFTADGVEIKPKDLKVGDEILVSKPPRQKIYHLTTELAWLYGFFYGDGCCSIKKRICKKPYGTYHYLNYSMHIDNKNIKLLKKCKEILKKQNIDSYIVRIKSENSRDSFSYRLIVKESNQKDFIKYIHSLFYNNGEKRVPKIILNADDKTIEAFLSGFAEADGYHKRDGEILREVCILGKLNTAQIAFLLDGDYKINDRKDKPDVYRIRCNLAYKRCPFDNTFVGEDGYCKYGHKITSGTVLKIEEIEYDDYVYDIETRETHRFTTALGNIVAHNTDGDCVFVWPFVGTQEEAYYVFNVLHDMTKNCERGRKRHEELLSEMMTYDEWKKFAKKNPPQKLYKNDDELWEDAVKYWNNRLLDGRLYQMIGGLKNRVFWEIYDNDKVWKTKEWNLADIQARLNIEIGCKEWLKDYPEIDWRKTYYDPKQKKLVNTCRQQMEQIIESVLNKQFPPYLPPRSSFSASKSRDTIPKLMEMVSGVHLMFENDEKMILNELWSAGVQVYTTRGKIRYNIRKMLAARIDFKRILATKELVEKIHLLSHKSKKDIWNKILRYWERREVEEEMRFAREYIFTIAWKRSIENELKKLIGEKVQIRKIITIPKSEVEDAVDDFIELEYADEEVLQNLDLEEE